MPWSASAPSGSRRGRVLAVCPAKGGVGGSSVATNLALALAGQPEKHVALVDFNVQASDLAFMLDVEATGGGRGMASGRIYTRDGALVATCLQEGLMRWNTPSTPRAT